MAFLYIHMYHNRYHTLCMILYSATIKCLWCVELIGENIINSNSIPSILCSCACKMYTVEWRISVPHLPPTEQSFSLLQPGYDSCSCNDKGAFHIFLKLLHVHSSGQSASSAGPQSQWTGRPGTWQWRTTLGGRGGEGHSDKRVCHTWCDQMTPCTKPSLVAYIFFTIVIICKVITIKDLSGLNQNWNASEHHMPGVIVQGSISTCGSYVWHGCAHACSSICCMCVCVHTMLTESADWTSLHPI